MSHQDLEIDGTRVGKEVSDNKETKSVSGYMQGVFQREQCLICIHYRLTVASHTKPNPSPPCPKGAAAALAQKEETLASSADEQA